MVDHKPVAWPIRTVAALNSGFKLIPHDRKANAEKFSLFDI